MGGMTLDRPMYRVKQKLLGKPLTTERVTEQKLSNRTALGVLASDCISSSAYGSEQMLRVLVPVVGAAAFSVVMPVTGAILLVLLLLTLCYSDVVTLYTRAAWAPMWWLGRTSGPTSRRSPPSPCSWTTSSPSPSRSPPVRTR